MSAAGPSSSLRSATESARILNISLRSFRDLLTRGQLAFIRVTPRRIAIEESELARFIASRRVQAR